MFELLDVGTQFLAAENIVCWNLLNVLVEFVLEVQVFELAVDPNLRDHHRLVEFNVRPPDQSQTT